MISRLVYYGTSAIPLSLEADLWSALDDICFREKKTLEAIITTLSSQWLGDELPAALWLFAINYFRDRTLPMPVTVEHEVSAAFELALDSTGRGN